MRKVTARIRKAFRQGQSLKVDNTETDGITVWLHGNVIVRREPNGQVWATLAGHNTRVTRERVNGITDLNFHQVNFQACLDGRPINDEDWFVASSPTAQANAGILF
jgi:hypothetical protein